MRIKILALVFLAVLSASIQAQNIKTDSVKNTSITYRAELGYGQTYRYGDYIVMSPYHIIRAGGIMEFGLNKGIGIETGLKYSYATGNREQLYNNSDTAFFSYTGHLLDMPVRVTYTIPIFWGLKVFGYAGPNINIGLSQKGKTRFEPKKTDQTNPLPLPIPGTYDIYKDMNRLSIQLGAGGGIQWKNYRIRSGYDWGLNNIGKDKNRSEHLRGWHVALEYEF